MQPLINSVFVRENPKILVEDNKNQITHNGHSYNIGCNELPALEEIVEKIIQRDKSEYEESLKGADPEEMKFLQKKELEWEKQKQLYLKMESFIRENKDKIPSWQVAGPLNYGMSLEQMKDVITNRFKEMALSGNLMTEEFLNANHPRETFYPPAGRGSNNLTRIWGAEFLKSNLLPTTKLNAAEHFLVVDDSESEIEVQVWHGKYPYLSIVNNAHVLSQKIEGTRKAWEYRFSNELNKLRYRDFKDPGNIICDLEGTGWIVDTELKSFDAPQLSRITFSLNNYLKKRFEFLVGNDCLYHTFKITIKDLKLK